MEVFHAMTEIDKELVLIIDATGNICLGLPKPLGDKAPLLYSVVIASHVPGATDFPIYEFTSTAHSFSDISGMLLHYFERLFV